MTTYLTSPYATLPPEDKIKVHSGISRDHHDVLFLKMFPRHGAQDRIIASLLSAFVTACNNAGIPHMYTKNNEEIAVNLLSHVSFPVPTTSAR